MFLSLKSIAWNQTEKKFVSPSRQDFSWPKGIVESTCSLSYCSFEKGKLPLDHTCGLYSSPDVETISEYHEYPNSIIVLLNLYGRNTDLWTAPKDIPGCYVLRSWGAKIIGVQHEEKHSQRYQAVALAAQYYGVKVFPAEMIRDMIKQNWLKTAREINNLNLLDVALRLYSHKGVTK